MYLENVWRAFPWVGETNARYIQSGMYPGKTKGEPKAGQVFSQITNPNPGQIIYVIKMRPKAGESRSGGVLNSLCISLEQICWFSIDY